MNIYHLITGKANNFEVNIQKNHNHDIRFDNNDNSSVKMNVKT
jgi:hypothetical protein